VFNERFLLLLDGGWPLTAWLPALLLAAALYLFLATKVELRLAAKRAVTRVELESALCRWTGEFEELRARLNEIEREGSLVGQSAALECLRQTKLTGECEEMRTRLRDLEGERRNAPEPGAEPDALNLNRRALILSLHRKGKLAREIAAALRIPQGEVELMVKVHDLSQSASRQIHAIPLL
jgi:hypothetical protein